MKKHWKDSLRLLHYEVIQHFASFIKYYSFIQLTALLFTLEGTQLGASPYISALPSHMGEYALPTSPYRFLLESLILIFFHSDIFSLSFCL